MVLDALLAPLGGTKQTKIVGSPISLTSRSTTPVNRTLQSSSLEAEIDDEEGRPDPSTSTSPCQIAGSCRAEAIVVLRQSWGEESARGQAPKILEAWVTGSTCPDHYRWLRCWDSCCGALFGKLSAKFQSQLWSLRQADTRPIRLQLLRVPASAPVMCLIMRKGRGSCEKSRRDTRKSPIAIS